MASNDAPVFEGFPDSTLKFLQDLRKNNDKAWFNEHRTDYEAAFKRPAQDFCAAMEERLTELAGMPLNSKVYRVNRDLRFSKDKTPYNTHLHISFRPGTGVSSAPSFAFGLDPKMLTVGAGTFGFEKQLDSYRENMSGDAGGCLIRRDWHPAQKWHEVWRRARAEARSQTISIGSPESESLAP